MFGVIDTFDGSNNKFSNHTGSEYNTNVRQTGGAEGDLNSAFAVHLSLSTNAERDARVLSAPPMFREINAFAGDRNVFENLVGDRYNYGSKPGPPASPSDLYSQPSIAITHASQATPSPVPLQTSETSTAAIMFHRIHHFGATNTEFNNRVGNEINVNTVEGREGEIARASGETSTDD